MPVNLMGTVILGLVARIQVLQITIVVLLWIVVKIWSAIVL
jgi:hypothetical protein